MIKDFLYGNDSIVLENVSAMAMMMGEDPDIACESEANVEKTKIKFRERIKRIVQKIKEFIQKVINWIKGKFLKLIKAETIEVDQLLWLNTINAIKELDSKVKLNSIESFRWAAFVSYHTNVVNTDDTGTQRKKMEDIATNVKKRFAEVTEGKYYTNAISGKTNGKTITANVKGFSSKLQKMEQNITVLKNFSDSLHKAMAETNEARMQNYMRNLATLTEVVNIHLTKLNIEMKLINTLMGKTRVQ